MKNNEQYEPQAEHKFSFGLWTLGNRGRDPFGDFVRPVVSPIEIVRNLGELGAWGVNLHDNDLVPIGATPRERDAIVRATQLLAHVFDKDAISKKRLPYELLDQLTVDLLAGLR